MSWGAIILRGGFLGGARCAMSAVSKSAGAGPRCIPLDARSSWIAAMRCSRWPRLVMPTCENASFVSDHARGRMLSDVAHSALSRTQGRGRVPFRAFLG